LRGGGLALHLSLFLGVGQPPLELLDFGLVFAAALLLPFGELLLEDRLDVDGRRRRLRLGRRRLVGGGRRLGRSQRLRRTRSGRRRHGLTAAAPAQEEERRDARRQEDDDGDDEDEPAPASAGLFDVDLAQRRHGRDRLGRLEGDRRGLRREQRR